MNNFFENFENIFSELFVNGNELFKMYNDSLKELEKNRKSDDKDDTKLYKHFDTKVYKNNELVDHIEREYKNGKCTLNIDDHKEPETCLGVIKSSSPVLDNGCCGDKKSCETKLPNTGYFTTERILELDEKCHKQCDEIKSLKMDKESLEEENTKLKAIIAELRADNTTFRNKLNEIKNIF